MFPKRARVAVGGLAITLAALVATFGTGCGDSGQGDGAGEPFSLALDFYVNPDHAGIFTALDRGYFADSGLDISTQVPSDPSAPIRQVATGRVDLAVSYEPEVILARNQGLPVTAVAALVPRPLTSLISLPSAGISKPAELAGKTIATAGIPYQTDFLAQILSRAGLSLDDVTQVDVGLGLLPALLSGRADAMLGGFLNIEGVDLAERGHHPRVVPVDRLGIPTYDELVLVASSSSVASDPGPIRAFIAALARGTRAAADDPAAATDAVLKAGQGLDPELTEAEVERTLPLLLPRDRSRPYGYMDPAAWHRFAAFFANRDLVDRALSANELLTDELLPPAGARASE